MNLNDFITLSEFLLGVPFQPPLPTLTALDPDLANVYLNQLTTAYSPALMTQLLGVWTTIQKQPKSQWTSAVQQQIMSSATLGELAQNIILAWYVDFHTFIGANTSPSPDPANYEQTLVWVLAQAHPMGVPLSFGYWQFKPTGTGA